MRMVYKEVGKGVVKNHKEVKGVYRNHIIFSH